MGWIASDAAEPSRRCPWLARAPIPIFGALLVLAVVSRAAAGGGPGPAIGGASGSGVAPLPFSESPAVSVDSASVGGNGRTPAAPDLSPDFIARWQRYARIREQSPRGRFTGLIDRVRRRRPAGNPLGSTHISLTEDPTDVLPPRVGTIRAPGSLFNPGASGPGVSASEDEPILGGLFDPRAGWPFVIGFHYQPRPTLTENFWIVATYSNVQLMTLDSWRNLEVGGISADAIIERRRLDDLHAAMPDRVVVIQVHGSLTYFDAALAGGLWAHAWLTLRGAMPPNALFIDFDWPSWRVFKSDVRDINEKGRRAYIAGLHLAQLIQTFPPGTRVCLIGQSYGGRVVLSALHLLGGGQLDSQSGDPPVRLPGARPDLRLRAIIIGAAADHDWLAPGQRFDRALFACEGLLNLHNSRDVALKLYPLLFRGGQRPSIGRRGLTAADFQALGPLAARIEQRDILDEVGPAHTLLDTIADQDVARWMAPYIWMPRAGARSDPGRLPDQPPES